MVRIGVGIVRSITTGASRRHYSKVRTTEVTTGFDKAWRTMGEEQKAQVIKEYSALEAQDWHTLTVDQKLYTIAYGAPEIVDPNHGWKVAGGVAAVLTTGLGMFALARSFANPPPRTLAPEYVRAQEEYLKSQNANPIFGISSKKDTDEIKL